MVRWRHHKFSSSVLQTKVPLLTVPDAVCLLIRVVVEAPEPSTPTEKRPISSNGSASKTLRSVSKRNSFKKKRGKFDRNC